jgi:outer membrane autotransporter protein
VSSSAFAAPPVATDDSYAVTAGFTLIIGAPGLLANDTDADGDTLSVVPLSTSVPHPGVLFYAFADGSFAYGPLIGFVGVDSFTYTITDGTTTSTATVTLVVGGEAPVSADDNYSTPKNTPLVVPASGVLGNDTDANGDTMTASVVTDPANGAVSIDPTGSFTYTPDVGFSGVDTFTYRARDSHLDGNIATVTINVVNAAPVARNDTYETPMNTPLVVPSPGLLGNDSDADGDPLSVISYDLSSVPPFESFSGQLSGAFTFTPAPGFTGPVTFSYTIGDGIAGASATVTITVAQTVTATILTSSANPSLLGQPVTFTANVSPAPVAGTVSFTDGAVPLCASVPITGGTATCTTTFTGAGNHPVTATYSGGGGSGGSASPVLVQAVNDQRTKTVAAIASFMSERNNLILSNGPDGARQIDRLTAAKSASAGGGNPATSLAPLLPGTSATPMGLSPALSLASRSGLGAMDDQTSSWASPFRANGSSDGQTRLNFSTSLSHITAAARARDASAATELGFSGTQPPELTIAPFDIWIEGRYVDFSDNEGNADIDGHFGFVTAGADYVFNSSVLLGVMVQFDAMRQRSDRDATEVSGEGWMAGPYATLRLSDNVFLQGRALYGQSRNEVSPFLTYTDRFDTERWLVGANLTGRWTWGGFTFAPEATLAYIEDTSEAYADTFGTLIPEVTTRLGQFTAGPQVRYLLPIDGDMRFETYGGFDLVWNFADEAKSDIAIDGIVAGPSGARGRVELGMRAMALTGTALDLSATYDGIGSDYSALSSRAAVQIPFD